MELKKKKKILAGFRSQKVLKFTMGRSFVTITVSGPWKIEINWKVTPGFGCRCPVPGYTFTRVEWHLQERARADTSLHTKSMQRVPLVDIHWLLLHPSKPGSPSFSLLSPAFLNVSLPFCSTPSSSNLRPLPSLPPFSPFYPSGWRRPTGCQ